jgi:DNA-binding transcriptional LysR family regulator
MRLEVRELLSEEVLVAMSPGHPFAARKSVLLRSLLEEVSLVLSMPGHGLRAQVDEAAHALGVEITGRVELRSQQAPLAMVAGRGGIALAPAMSVTGRDDVVSRPLVPPLRRTTGWVRRRGTRFSLPRNAEGKILSSRARERAPHPGRRESRPIPV